MNEAQTNCDHEWSRYSIAMIGIRWQCDKCDLIAPACFVPIASKTAAEQFFDDHIKVVHIS